MILKKEHFKILEKSKSFRPLGFGIWDLFGI